MAEGGPVPRLKDKIGFVLSGGIGLAHFSVGVLEILIEHGIIPDYIVAVSSGGLVASKYVETRDMSAVIELAETAFKKPPYFFNPKVVGHALILNLTKPDSFYNNKELKEIIDTKIDIDEIMDSPIEFEVLAINLMDGTPYFFSNKRNSADIFQRALLATTSLPGFFPPVEAAGSLWIDGAMHSPFPLTRAIEIGCTKIFGIHCMPDEDELTKTDCQNLGWLRTLARGQWLNSEELTQHEIAALHEHNKRARQALLLSKMAKGIIPTALRRDARSILKSDFGDKIPTPVEFTLFRAPRKLLIEPAKWKPSDIKLMQTIGNQTALDILND